MFINSASNHVFLVSSVPESIKSEEEEEEAVEVVENWEDKEVEEEEGSTRFSSNRARWASRYSGKSSSLISGKVISQLKVC